MGGTRFRYLKCNLEHMKRPVFGLQMLFFSSVTIVFFLFLLYPPFSLSLLLPQLSASSLDPFITCLCILHPSVHCFTRSFLNMIPLTCICHFFFFPSTQTLTALDLAQTADRRLYFLFTVYVLSF